jgi:Cu/Zn superoxide dismutase
VLSYSLKGMDANAAHGVHIHAGRRCDADTGGHLWDANKGPDAWGAVQVFADDKGRAFGSFDVDNVVASLPFVANLDHTVTIHSGAARGGVRTGCAVLRAKVPFGVKASIGLYPGSSVFPVGQVVLDAANVLTFLLVGLPAGTTGTLRIHAGASCSAAGADWYDAAAAQAQGQAQAQNQKPVGWLNSVWRSGADGEARGMFNLNQVPGLFPFAQNVGRVVVVHDAGGAPIGCGRLQPFAGSAVSADDVVPQAQFDFGVSSGRFERMRGFNGSSFAKGRVWLDTDNVLTFVLSDLEPNKTGGIHIHSGTNCSAVQGHFNLPAAQLDGWSGVNWTSSLGGFARGVVDLAQSVTSAYDFAANLNRVVVVHSSSGAMQSCVVLRRDPLYGVYGAVQPYVGLAQGAVAPTGKVYLGRWNILSWFLHGLEPNSAGGIHIHAAAGPTACTDPAGTGTQWFNASKGPNPWALLSWTSSASGVATGIVNLYDIVGAYAFRDNVYHAVTIHNAAGAKVGCALLHTFAPLIRSEVRGESKGVAEVEAKDKYALKDDFVAQGAFAPFAGKDIGDEKAPTGTVALNSDNVLTFHLSGLVPRARGAIAIFAAKACSAEDQGGDRWIQDAEMPDPWSVVQWASDPKGIAKGIIDLDALSENGFNFAGNLGHAVVVSSALSPSLRLACATLSTRGQNFGLKAFMRKVNDPNAMNLTAGSAVAGVAFLDHNNKLSYKLAGVAPSAKHVVAIHEDQFCDVPDSPVFAKVGATQVFDSAATSSAVGVLQGAIDLAKINGAYEFERNAYKSIRVASANNQIVACGSLSVFKLQTASQALGGGKPTTPSPSGQASSPPVPPTPPPT